MLNTVGHLRSTLAAWPAELVTGVVEQASRLAALGSYGAEIGAEVATLPAAALMHKATGGDDAAAQHAFAQIEDEHMGTSLSAFHINSNVGAALATAEGAPSKRVNPIFRRSILQVRDALVPPGKPEASLAERLDEPVRDAIRRFEATPPRTTGRVANEAIMLTLIGLSRVSRHPGFAHYALEGAPPPKRGLAADLANVVGFVVAVLAGPFLMGLRRGTVQGLGASLLGLYVGGLVVRYKKSHAAAVQGAAVPVSVANGQEQRALLLPPGSDLVVARRGA